MIMTALTDRIDGAEITGKDWSLDQSYSYCEKLARAHYENFPVGSILIPLRLRKHVYAIYAFARIADDFADECYGGEIGEQDRLNLLRKWGELLKSAYADTASHPVFIALADTAERFGLPSTLFQDLLSAFIQDVKVRRYNTCEELLDYCRRSANPIGRLILHLFGYMDETMMRESDCICTALQLANHWQDVGIDLDKDRLYLPMEDMAEYGVTVDDLRQRHATRNFRGLMRREVSLARGKFIEGAPLCVRVKGRLRVELRATWLGGMRILQLIRKNRYDVFSRRPTISRYDKFAILIRALGRGQLTAK
jgi:phytoene synthase